MKLRWRQIEANMESKNGRRCRVLCGRTLTVHALIVVLLLAHSKLSYGQEAAINGAVPRIDDPAQDGWSTELMQDAAAAQLSLLATKMVSRPSPTSWDSLLSETAQCTHLRPARTAAAFRDGSVEVIRGVSSEDPPLRYQGFDGFDDALDHLILPDEQSVRIKFKIYRIVATEGGFQTRQFCWLSAQSPSALREVHAVWNIQWSAPDDASPPKIQIISLADFEESRTRRSNNTLLTDCTGSILAGNACLSEQFGHGVDYWSNRMLWVGTEGMQGLAIGDANGDGLEDLYVCQISPLPNRLFIQNADGTLSDRSSEYGVDWLEPTHSALFIDLDNDGDQDLLASTRAALLVMENVDHKSYITRLTYPAARNAYSLSAADYDNDGDLDVFACVYLARARHREILAIPVPFHDARNGGRNVLLRNDGGWRFHDDTRDAGLEHEATRRSFASSWEDYDNDGDLDLYVANDYGRNNLFRNDAGHFVDVASTAGVEDQSFGMSAAWGDFDRDGWMDLYVSNMFSAAGNRIVYQRQFRADDDPDLRRKFQYMARGNSLFRNAGDGRFEDVSLTAAVNVAYWAWGSQFVDLNNDGWQDLVVANGFLTRQATQDL